MCGVSPTPGLSGRRRDPYFIAATNPNGRAHNAKPTALSAAAALPADSGAALTPTLSLKREGILRTSVEFAVSNAADEPEP